MKVLMLVLKFVTEKFRDRRNSKPTRWKREFFVWSLKINIVSRWWRKRWWQKKFKIIIGYRFLYGKNIFIFICQDFCKSFSILHQILYLFIPISILRWFAYSWRKGLKFRFFITEKWSALIGGGRFAPPKMKKRP